MTTEIKATHTPGPWKAGRGIDDDDTRCFVTQGIDGQPDYLIAEIENGAPGDCLETELANARLIAAAPDLYSAVKEFLEWGAMTGSDRDLHEQRFRAAIAKAEGVQ